MHDCLPCSQGSQNGYCGNVICKSVVVKCDMQRVVALFSLVNFLLCCCPLLPHCNKPQTSKDMSFCSSPRVTLPAAVTIHSAHFDVCAWLCERTSVCVCMLMPYVSFPRYSFISAKSQKTTSHLLYAAVSAHTLYTSTQQQRKTRYLPMRNMLSKKKKGKNCRKVFMHACVIPCGFSSSGPWHFIRPLLESLNPNLWYSIILIKSCGL